MREKKGGKLMESLPDEIWLKIFKIGVIKSNLHSDDLCNLSMSSKRFNHLSNDNTLWSTLLTLKDPESAAQYSSYLPSCSSIKSLYYYTSTLGMYEAVTRFTKLMLRVIESDPLNYYENSKTFYDVWMEKLAEIEDLSQYSDILTEDPSWGPPPPGEILAHYHMKREQLLHSQKRHLAAMRKFHRKINVLLGRPLDDDDEDEENHEAEDDDSEEDAKE